MTVEQWQQLEDEAQELVERLMEEIPIEQRYTAQGEQRYWYKVLLGRAERRVGRRVAARRAQEDRDQALRNLRLIRELSGDPTIDELVQETIDLLAVA